MKIRRKKERKKERKKGSDGVNNSE